MRPERPTRLEYDIWHDAPGIGASVNAAFGERVRAREVVVGTFLNLASPLAAEIVGLAGVDWVVIDLEHGPGTERDALAQMQALAHTGAAPLVRVEAIDRARFLHALDMGAAGLVVPRLGSVEDAERCVDFSRYSGSRGVARYNRSWQWGAAGHAQEDADAAVVCAVQIETRAALETVEEIAAVEGVDVLFVGPVDLAHSLGIAGGADHPELLRQAARVADAAAAAGKAAGMLVGSLEIAALYRDLGFTFLGCSSDSGLLTEGARRVASGLKALREAKEMTA
jgi:2-keto-3-deoxy-L-rhamnonate aldolase RhmA